MERRRTTRLVCEIALYIGGKLSQNPGRRSLQGNRGAYVDRDRPFKVGALLRPGNCHFTVRRVRGRPPTRHDAHSGARNRALRAAAGRTCRAAARRSYGRGAWRQATPPCEGPVRALRLHDRRRGRARAHRVRGARGPGYGILGTTANGSRAPARSMCSAPIRDSSGAVRRRARYACIRPTASM